MWYYLALILIVIVSVLLILIVLVQNPKGGGLTSGFSSAGQFGGVQQTNKFLEKTTWTLALLILGLSLIASIAIPRQEVQNQPTMSDVINSTDFNQAPVNPVEISSPADEDVNTDE